MKGKKVKFDDDGTQCKRDINYLRRNPQCGFIFIQDKPFQPDQFDRLNSDSATLD